MSERWERARRFLGEGIWEARPQEMPRHRALLYRLLRVSALVAKGFRENRCRLHASALTYTTLVSLVPFLAFAFAVAKSLNVHGWLIGPDGPVKRLSGPVQEVVRMIIDFVERTDVRTLGAVGLLVLLWTVIRMLSTIEATFNEIWGVLTPRTFFRKFSDYLSVVAVCPVLVAVAMILTVTLTSEGTLARVQAMPWVGPYAAVVFRTVSLGLFHLLPYAAVCGAFSFLYLFLPNTRVPFRCAMGGGLVAGITWQVGQFLYLHGNVRLAEASKIYASFASFPIFLVWLFLSWLIALFGAEVAFALQHERTYSREGRSATASHEEKERLALQVAGAVADRFRKGSEPWDVNALAEALDQPVRLIQEIASRLESGGILKAIPGPVVSYHPARTLEGIPLKSVLDAVRRSGHPAPSLDGVGGAVAEAVMSSADAAVAARLASLTLDDFARGALPGDPSDPSSRRA